MNHAPTDRILTALLVTLMMTAPLLAQEPAADKSQTEAADSEQQESESPPPANSDNKTDTGVFRPSEEISEDLSVPFPIDI